MIETGGDYIRHRLIGPPDELPKACIEGVEQPASFACYLRPDYEALYQPVDIVSFAEEVKK